MITIKLSHSILAAWAEYRYEDAVGMYLGKELPESPYLELGKVKHKLWENYVNKHGELPAELGGGKIDKPQTEKKWQKIIPLSDNYQILLRGVIDLESVDGKDDVITDYKCGIGTPTSYVDKVQLDYYKLLRPQATLGRYICHNPYKCEAWCSRRLQEPHNCFTVGIKYLSDKNAQNALEHLITYGSEFINYLEVSKLIIDYEIK